MNQRVLIFQLPSLLRQIVLDAIEIDGRAKVVECGDGEEDFDLVEAINRFEPDVIVTTLKDRGSDPAFAKFLSEKRGRSVLAIERIGRSAYLFSKRSEPLPLGEVSTDVVVKAIHGDIEKH